MNNYLRDKKSILFMLPLIMLIVFTSCVERTDDKKRIDSNLSKEINFSDAPIVKINKSKEDEFKIDMLGKDIQEIIEIAGCINREYDCQENKEEAGKAIIFMGESNNKVFIKPLIDLLWINSDLKNVINQSLKKLTNQDIFSPINWEKWANSEIELELPENYLKIKSDIFTRLDKNYSLIFQNEFNQQIEFSKVNWIGSTSDSIPALSNPTLISKSEVAYLSNNDIVIGINIDNKEIAFPIKIIKWHGVINQKINNKIYSIIYCPVSNSITAFKSNIGNLSFSSLFMENSCLMKNNQGILIDTETGIYGDRKALKRLPIMQATWTFWKTYYPNSKVLSKNTGIIIDYDEVMPQWAKLINPGNLVQDITRYEPKDSFNTYINYSYAGEKKEILLYKIYDYRIVYQNIGTDEFITIILDDGIGARTFYAPPDEINQISYTSKNGWLARDTENIYWFISDNGLINQDDSSFYSEIANYISYKKMP
tara:strand:+ start:1908 stop:3353 length:1446 start_codon:yes stop_codon:yes gene_type:complete